ncbi:hypothetical protein ACFCQI_09440 [Rhodanobacter sp. FW102-FHT14D06]|uniref:Uncharacterized protein n=2 Tax=unclassified Rhodanobacter TaxID=2621553 RepID=A0AB74UN03_9GAMM
MSEQKHFVEFLESKAKEMWEERRSPYMLSSIAVDYNRDGYDYHQVLGNEKLKTGVKRLGIAANFDVVEHPTQRAKIGLVPKDVDFDFGAISPVEQNPAGVKTSRRSGISNERVLINFLRVIRSLPDDMTKDVIIPLNVLARFVSE